MLFAGGRAQFALKLPGKAQIDVLLIDDHAVQLHERDLGRHGVEIVVHQRIFEKLRQE